MDDFEILNRSVMDVAVVIDQVEGATPNAVSLEIDLRDQVLTHITMPAAWTAADLSFGVCWDDDDAFTPLYDEFGAEVVVKAAASRTIRLNITDWLGVKRLKIRSGTKAAPINQTTARTLKLILVK